jgi:hypothetical protein
LIKLKLGVIQKPLAIYGHKALSLQASGSVKGEVQKQMFLSLLFRRKIATCSRKEDVGTSISNTQSI